MIVTLGKWEIQTNLSRDLGYEVTRTNRPDDPDLLEAAGDFIARQVLEKDSIFLEG